MDKFDKEILRELYIMAREWYIYSDNEYADYMKQRYVINQASVMLKKLGAFDAD